MFTHTLKNPLERYYLALALVILLTMVSQRLLQSRIGRAWLAGSEDEIAATSSGVPLARYKTWAFVVGMAMVILGGAGSVPARSWGR